MILIDEFGSVAPVGEQMVAIEVIEQRFELRSPLMASASFTVTRVNKEVSIRTR